MRLIVRQTNKQTLAVENVCVCAEYKNTQKTFKKSRKEGKRRSWRKQRGRRGKEEVKGEIQV